MSGWDASSTAAVISAAIALLAWVASLVQLLISRKWRRQDEASTAHRLLAAFEQEYASVVQPALATLADFKWQYPDGALWTALSVVPQKANAANGLGQPAGAALQEHRARNAAKDFWRRLLTAMENRQLPPGFGGVTRLPDGCRIIDFGTSHDGDTWRERANNFRLLAEPFDVANYYRMGLHRTKSGHYLEDDNRPSVFRDLEAMTIAHVRAQPPAATPLPAAPAPAGATALAAIVAAASAPTAQLQPQQDSAVAAAPGTQPAAAVKQYVSSVVWALALANGAAPASQTPPRVPAPAPPADWGWGSPAPPPETLLPTRAAPLPP